MRATLFAAGVVALSAAAATAQPQVPNAPGGGGRANYSPYLNLLRGGSPALNYYGLVKPQQQFAMQANQLQTQINQTNNQLQQTNQAVEDGSDPTLPATGRGATFGFYSHYFNNFGTAAGGTGGLRASSMYTRPQLPGNQSGFGQQNAIGSGIQNRARTTRNESGPRPGPGR